MEVKNDFIIIILLLAINEAEDYCHDNQYILTGYRINCDNATLIIKR